MNLLLEKAVSTASKYLLLLVFIAPQLLMRPVLADEVVNVSNINECRSISDKAERLLCYDTFADGGIFNQQQVEEKIKEEFGNKKKEFENSDDRIFVTIVRIQNGIKGIQYFHTDDGAAWKKSGRGKWKLDVPFKAEIKTGVFSSYFLVTESGKSARVERVR